MATEAIFALSFLSIEARKMRWICEVEEVDGLCFLLICCVKTIWITDPFSFSKLYSIGEYAMIVLLVDTGSQYASTENFRSEVWRGWNWTATADDAVWDLLLQNCKNLKIADSIANAASFKIQRD